MRIFLALLLVSTPALAQPAASPSTTRYFSPAGSHQPFSSAVRIGGMVYVSGQIGISADGTLSPDFATQANAAMKNVAAALSLAGATMDDVYKCNVALADMNDWQAFNRVYVAFFKSGRLPVRMASGANGLAKGASVEVTCEANTTSP